MNVFGVLFILLLHCLLSETRRMHGRSEKLLQSRHKNRVPTSPEVLNVRMPGVSPTKDDDYWCTYYDVDTVAENVYITQFEAKANGSIAHHIILFGCSALSDENLEAKAWNCLEGSICQGQSSIMFAWAKNADPTTLPADVGFDIGSGFDKKYLVMQVHYAHKGEETTADTSGLDVSVTTTPPKYSAGIYILFAGMAPIPPRTSVFHVDVNCLYEQNAPLHVFAYRVHAHSLGVVITGYKFSHDVKKVQEIARGNPNWPQAFYPEKEIVTISPDEWVAARCTYNSSTRNTVTNIGSTAGDEMCNLYLMYYAERDSLPSYLSCAGDNVEGLAKRLPKDSDRPLPPNPLMEEIAHSGHGSAHSQHDHHDEEPHKNETSISSSMTSHGQSTKIKIDVPVEDQGMGFELVENWPEIPLEIGQPTAVFYTSDGTLMVFHRGDRVWDGTTFDTQNNFKNKSKGPIKSDTVVEMIPETGKITRTWGSNLFYLPHGLSVDHLSNTWLTDVALHQVFKFTQNDLKTPAMVLGTAFESGNDEKHFCKPTSVAVTSDGSIFVADGYCNSRIVKFDYKGNFVAQWGSQSNTNQVISEYRHPGTWLIPHSIVPVEDRGLVCAADRENARVQCMDMTTGDVKSLFYLPNKDMGAYAIAYTQENGGRLWVAAAGMNTKGWTGDVQIFDMNTGYVIGSFGPLSRAHDLAVDPKTGNVYVADLTQPFTIKRFRNGKYIYNSEETETEPNEESLSLRDLPKSIKQLLSSNVLDTFTPLLIASLLAAPVLAILSVTLCIRLRRRNLVAESQQRWFKGPKSRTGFRRLRQEDTIALNSDDATTDSDEEDILYTATVNKKKNARC